MGAGKMYKVPPKTQKDKEQDKELMKLKKQVRTIALNQEEKQFDVSIAPFSIDWLGTLQAINDVPQGSGVAQRAGSEYTGKSVDIRGTLSLSGTSIVNKVRVLLINQKMPRGSTLTITQVFQALDNVTPVYSANFVNSPYNSNERDTFEILWERTYIVSDRDKIQVPFHIKRKYKKKVQQNAGLTSSFDTNRLYMVFLSDADPASGGNRPQCEYISRLNFYD